MIKILLHFHFAEMPDSAAQAADFREKVMQYIENSYKFPNNPEFERKIRKEFEFLLNGEIFNESSFTDLMSDFIS